MTQTIDDRKPDSKTRLALLRFSVDHPRIIFAITGLLLVAASLCIPRINFRLDASSLIPIDNPQLVSSARAANLFGLRDAIIIGIVDNQSSIYNADTLKKLIRLSDAVGSVPGVAARSVVSLATMPVASVRNG